MVNRLSAQNYRGRSARLALMTSLAALSAAPALAQRANLAPVLGSTGPLGNVSPSNVNAEASIPTVAQQKPAADANRRFAVVRAVRIEGGFPEFQPQMAALTAGIQGRRISLADAYGFAASVQQAYLAAGYPLVAARLEPQAFDRGEIRVRVVDGFIESLDLSGVPAEIRGLVSARLSPVVGRRHLTSGELQRHIQLLGELPGVNGGVASKLANTVGGVVLVVSATQTPFTSTTSVNNYLPSEYGTYLFTQSFSVNNALGFGENLHAGFSSSDDFGRFFSGTAKSESFNFGGFVPIGADGFTLGAGYAQSRGLPSPAFALLGPGYFVPESANDELQRVSVRANYPLLLTKQQSVHVQLGFDFVDNVSSLTPYPYFGLFGLPGFSLFHDQYEDLRAAAEWHVAFPWEWGGNAISAVVYEHGLGGLNGSLLEPLSRPGASPDFSKLVGEVHISQPLPANLVLSLMGRAQTSFGQSLMQSEEMQLAGPDALSGFGLGTIYVDSGAVGRAELQRPFPVQLGSGSGIATPYLFGAVGGGVFEKVYLGQDPNVTATSFGAGVRANGRFTGWPFNEALSLELARVNSNVPYAREGYAATFSYQMAYAGDPFGAPQLGLARTVDRGASDFTASGFYAGLNSGYAFDASPGIASTGMVVSNAADSFYLANGARISAANITGAAPASGDTPIGGGQVGYNFISRGWLLGAEADIQGAGQASLSQSTRMAIANVNGDPQPVTTVFDDRKSLDWLGTVRGRAGMAATPDLLAYVTGGLAYGGVGADARAAQNWPDTSAHTPYSLASTSVASGGYSDTLVGWTIGGGLEWMFAPGVSLKGEYLYYDLGQGHFPSGTLVTAPLSGIAGSNVVASASSARFDGHIVRLGLNYHFGAHGEQRPLIVKGPEVRTGPVWTGFYAGLNGGYDWAVNSKASNSAVVGSAALDHLFGVPFASFQAAAIAGSSRPAPNGYIGGGQVGYSLQLNRGLLGLEADIQGAGANGHGAYTTYDTTPPLNLFAMTTHVENTAALDWLGTLRGRLGLFLRSDLLGYLTGGLAYGGTSSGTFIDQQWNGTLSPVFHTTGSTGQNSSFMTGWTIGTGLEWMFSSHMSLKAEYLYYDLGVARYGSSPAALTFGLSNSVLPTTAFRYDGQLVRAGLNYHFD
jgi:hemolysin activation/secretion protein